MKVKDIVLAAAKAIGAEKEVELYLSGGATQSKCVDVLLECFNRVENELALDYLPLIVEEKMSSVSGCIAYNDFGRSVVRVIKVEDEWGNSLPFRLYANYLKTEAGKVNVSYTYTPEEKQIEEETDFTLFVSERLFVYGIAHEYCLASGLYEDAAIWDKKYKDAVAAAQRESGGKRIKGRVWV